MEINTKTKAGLITLIRVLRKLWTDGPASRATLARELELDKSTLTKVCGRLIKAGLIHQVREGSVGRQGGRRPTLLDIRAAKGAIAGLEIQPDRIRMVYTDLQGQTLMEETREILSSNRKLSALLDTVTEGFSREHDGLPVLGAGIAIPGIIDPWEGKILRSTPLHVDEPFPLAAEMEGRLGVPVVCDNDANCCAWGSIFGISALEDRAGFAVLLGDLRDRGLSTGFSFVLGGEEVYHGSGYSAGEFRSIFCPEEGDRQFGAATTPSKGTIPTQTPADTMEELCRNTAFLVNMLNLDAVVIAGTLTDEPDTFSTTLQREIRRNWIYPPAPECPVFRAPGGAHSAAFGAAALFLRRLCRVPVLSRTGYGNDGSLFLRVLGSSL